VEVCSPLLAELQFNITEDGLMLSQLDESHTALTILELSAEYFEELDAGDEGYIRFTVTDMKKALKRIKADDTIILSFPDEFGNLEIVVEGKRRRAFRTKMLNKEKPWERRPVVVPEARLKVCTEGLLMAVEDATFVGKKDFGYFEMETTATGLAVRAREESGLRSVENVLLPGWDIMAMEAKAGVKASYSMAYFNPIIRSAYKLAGIIQLEYGTDMPVKLDCQIPYMIYWLAPRVEKG